MYNISSQKGTITNEDGGFEMTVAVNDRLEITAIQIAGFKVVVTAKAVESLAIAIYLNPAINKLDEVYLTEHNLTGVLYTDVANINTFAVRNDFDTSYENMEFGYEFAPDGQTAIQGNAAEQALGNFTGLQNGFNVIAVAAVLVKAIIGTPKKKKTTSEIDNSIETQLAVLSEKFDDATWNNTFNIPEERVVDFKYYLIESKIPSPYLVSQNQLLLYNYIKSKSTIYLDIFENE